MSISFPHQKHYIKKNISFLGMFFLDQPAKYIMTFDIVSSYDIKNAVSSSSV